MVGSLIAKGFFLRRERSVFLVDGLSLDSRSGRVPGIGLLSISSDDGMIGVNALLPEACGVLYVGSSGGSRIAPSRKACL